VILMKESEAYGAIENMIAKAGEKTTEIDLKKEEKKLKKKLGRNRRLKTTSRLPYLATCQQHLMSRTRRPSLWRPRSTC
jgi:hypothetical protein